MSPHVVPGLHGLIKVVENWTFSLFFCTAELWGSVVIAVLFWTLANDVCTVKEAKTVYPMMGISANIALVVAGNFMKYMSATVLNGASTQTFLQFMVTAIICCSGLMVAVRPPPPIHAVMQGICVYTGPRPGMTPVQPLANPLAAVVQGMFVRMHGYVN